MDSSIILCKPWGVKTQVWIFKILFFFRKWGQRTSRLWYKSGQVISESGQVQVQVILASSYDLDLAQLRNYLARLVPES